jgi:hypothetical protein
MNFTPLHTAEKSTILLALLAINAAAGTLYVDINCTNPVIPYSDWSTAATNIQDAVDAAGIGDLVLVNDGVYQSGGRLVQEASVTTNRVAITKAITVQSVNGPAATVIRGYQVPVGITGFSAIRCVYLTNGAMLSGFTVTNGATSPSDNGGGVWCASAAGVVSNCVLTGNAAYYGGGAYSNTLINCTLSGNRAGSSGAGGGAAYAFLSNCLLTNNSAASGGGAYSASLNNSMLVSNSATSSGGGVYACTLNNCIVRYNHAPSYPNYYTGDTLRYCCTTPLPPGGIPNRTADPQLADSFHLSAGSPCRGAGSATYATGVDADGQPWLNPPSIGCNEFYSGSATGALSVAIQVASTNITPRFALDLAGIIGGHASASVWDFGDGTIVSNQPYATHSWAAGDYTVILRAYNDTYPSGVSTAITMHVVAPLHYVSLASAAPQAPYSSWATAATNVQDAVDAAAPGDEIVVSNGIYQAGARLASGATSNRLAVTLPVIVRSLNGPAVTVIQGYQVPGMTNGDGAIRCVWLADEATLVGFTLTNGATRTTGDSRWDLSGGGVLGGIVSNCVIAGNSASGAGGGGASSTLVNCTITGNSSQYGGGVSGGVIRNSILADNVAASWGGGACSNIMVGCVAVRNVAGVGGGVCFGTISNCTVTGNLARVGGGSAASMANNTIVFFNSATVQDPNWNAGGATYSCTTPAPSTGVGNFTNPPLFVDQPNGNFLLQSTSPCINAGANAYAPAGLDLDGSPRISGGTVDVEAYEFQNPASTISYAWLQQFGFPMDGTADTLDSDRDGMNNWQEWRAGTDPTNGLSALQMLAPTNGASGVTVTWQSVTNRSYYLQRSLDLSAQPPFMNAQSNIVGQAGTTTFTDTSAIGAGPFFYRVGVQ